MGCPSTAATSDTDAGDSCWSGPQACSSAPAMGELGRPPAGEKLAETAKETAASASARERAWQR